MKTFSKTISCSKAIIYISSIIILSLALLVLAGAFTDEFGKVMGIATYLAWHNLFEFCAVFISFAVFIVTFYTFNQTRKLKPMILGNTFLIVGLLDLAHTLSFKGMPEFFVANTEPNRATTFWVIARLTAGLGFLAASIVSPDRGMRSGKKLMLFSGLLFCTVIFVTVTYFPGALPPMYTEVKGLTEIKVILEYAVIFLFISAAILFLRRYHKDGDFLAVHLAAALLLSAYSEYAFARYSAVYDVYNYIGHIYKFLAYFLFFRVAFIRNVQQPYFELSKAQQDLRNYAENLDKLVEQRTLQLKDTNQLLMNDLDYARDIQLAMLPQALPKSDSFSIDARYFPAGKVSGDFYNFYMIDEDNVVVYIGDVSGHGVPAAMLTVFVNQCIKVSNEMGANSLSAAKPSSILRNLYESYNNTNFKDDVYIILVYGVYCISGNTFTYSSAGINVSPILLRNDGVIEELSVKGFPLCKLREFYSAEYQDVTLNLRPGDKILFYTDGLAEPQDLNGKLTQAGLNDILTSCGDMNSIETVAAIENALHRSLDMDKIKDDITFFVLEVK